SRVAAQTGGRINLDLTDGERFTVVDTVGTGSGNLIVKGAGDNDTDTAEDLGILNVTGVAASSFDGELIPNTIEAAPVATIQQLLDRINDATDTLGAANAGRLVASINATGDGIVLQDTTGGGGNFIILGAPGTSGSANAAKDLGIFTGAAGVAAPTVESGEALIATLNSTLVRDLNGGLGLNGASTLEITDRDGDFVSIGSLDQYTSVTQLLEAINTAIADAVNVDVSVTLNENGNGFRVVDSSGATASNLVVGGDAADAFGIAGDVAADRIDGANAQTRYVGEASLLTSLNYGRGVGTGSFRITDSLGQTATVSIDGDSRTLYDVIAEINSRGLSINARVNDNGDGLLIESTAGSGGFVPLKIESLSGTVASGLNIVGSADTSVDGFIDGSYERTVDLSTSDTLSEVVAKINAAAGVPASATIINTGAATNPFRLSITSEIGGRRGELTIDSTGADVDFSTMSVGKDAKVIFGGSADTGFLLTSTTNTLTDAVEGLTLTLKSVSNTPVTVNVERDTAGIVQKASEFVVAFNDAIGRIDDYDKYDVDTEERGILLGNPLTARARNALFRLVFTRAEGISSSYQTLREVGISVGSGGSINFDEDKFLEAYEADPDAVENLFTALAEAPVTSEEIAPGITVINGGTTTTQRGIGEIIDDLLNAFTDSIDGSFKRAGDGIQSQIDGMNERIGLIDEKLAAKRARLQAQFLAMETAIAQLQSQNSALSSLSG
ncbi:MAG: flagellar filament capping protein FliD, partial [Phycisphaerales bacterium]|nr:flagellar filament capping protein FliD [Phycisphaerales bacterium]